MKELGTKELREALRAVTAAIEENKDRLCELDGLIGDADHGLTLSVGFKAACESLDGLDEAATPTDLFNQAAKTFLNAMGGSSGPLYATAFMRAGAKAKGKQALDAADIAEVVIAMAQGIQDRGKAELGDKTMLDAWLPAGDAATQAMQGGASLAGVLEAAAQAARTGAEATKALQATKGRASRLGERSVGHIDPGAASTAMILESLAKFAAD